MTAVRIGIVKRRLPAALPVIWAVLIMILFPACSPNERPAPALVLGQSTDLHAGMHMDDQDAALGEWRSRRLNAISGEGDGTAGTDYEYEYVYEADEDPDVYAGGEDGGLEGKFEAFGKLSHDDIAQKDVFSARMQDVLSRRAQGRGTPGRIKVKTGKRYLAPRVGDRAGLSSGLVGGGQGDESHHQSNFIEVTFLTIGMALSAGFGALPFFFVKELSPTMNGLATAVACGVMFAASFDLIHEGQPYGAMMVIVGICLGAVFIQLMQRYLDSLGDVSFGKLHGAKAKRLILVVGIMVRCGATRHLTVPLIFNRL